MAQETVMGLVLSSRNIGESDRRIVLLTREKGKISAFARGAAKPRSPLVSATQPFTFGEFFIYAGRNSYTVTGAEVKNYFPELSKDLEKYYYATYLCEVADYYTRENLYAGDELLLLFQTLKALIKNTIGNELVRYIFEWRMLQLSGEVPNLTQCRICGGAKELHYFSCLHDGMVCQSCGEKKGSIILSQGTLYTLQYIVSSKLQSLYTFTVKEEVLSDLRKITKEYLELKRNHKFYSEEFLDLGSLQL